MKPTPGKVRRYGTSRRYGKSLVVIWALAAVSLGILMMQYMTALLSSIIAESQSSITTMSFDSMTLKLLCNATTFTSSARASAKKKEDEEEVTRMRAVHHHHQNYSYPPGADGTFNQIPIYYRSSSSPRYSSVRCVGESFQPDNSPAFHLSRSCHFQHLCFNITQKQFVLFPSPRQMQLAATVLAPTTFRDDEPRARVSTIWHNKSVASGPMGKLMREKIAKKKRKNDTTAFQWFPKIVTQSPPPSEYYELPANMIWVPFQSIAGFNPGHLLWDSWMTIFRLVQIFQLMPKDEPNNNNNPVFPQRLLLTRLHLTNAVWGTCQMTERAANDCQRMMEKFAPIMGIDPKSLSTTDNFEFTLHHGDKPQLDLVCARNGAAGLGLLADHGHGSHGQSDTDWEDYRFAGQGPLIRQFRDFGMHNLGLPTRSVVAQQSTISHNNNDRDGHKYRIVFSVNSSSNQARKFDFADEIAACQQAFQDNPHILIESVELASIPLVEQIEYISQTAILVSGTGGGTSTAMFLPDGASLILWYATKRKQPQYLDFAIFENAGYIQPHWFPYAWPVEKRSKALVELISYELDRIQRQGSQGGGEG